MKIGITEIRPPQIGPGQQGSAELHPGHVSLSQICMVEIRTRDFDFEHASLMETRLKEVRASQIY